jgi:Rieske Fe-S protein
MLGLVICAAAAAVSSGCTGAGGLPPGAIAFPIDELPDGDHVRRMRGTEPLDIIRTGELVVARSMFCTHMGCITVWNAAAKGYTCPCHGGAYDAEGKPIAGPPLEPLRMLPVRVDGNRVVILPQRPRG